MNNIDDRLSLQSGTKPSARAQSGRSRQSHLSWRERQVNGAGTAAAPSGQASNRYPSHSQREATTKEEKQSDRNPYAVHLSISGYLNNPDKPFGSSRDERSKIVQMIDSSRTS